MGIHRRCEQSTQNCLKKPLPERDHVREEGTIRPLNSNLETGDFGNKGISLKRRTKA